MTPATRTLAALAFAAAAILAPARVWAQQPAPAANHATPPSDPAISPSAPATHSGDHAMPPSAPAAPPSGHGPAPAGEAGGGGHEGENSMAFFGRLFNFLVLAGGLVYFLRTPLSTYLSSRSAQIRSDLVTAAATRASAAQERASIAARMTSLPAELAALKTRGNEEIAAEQARIKAAADTERQRLVEQARLEIEQQTRAARRDLREYAATLAVDVARTRLATEMTEADQSRLVDRYVAQVTPPHD